MTPAEQARQIEQQEFDAECRAARKRAEQYAAERREQERRRVASWLGRPEPTQSKAISRPRQAKVYTANGQSKTLTEWAEIAGVSIHTLRARLRSGMPIELAINMKARQRAKLHTVDGETKTLQQWADHAGIAYTSLLRRLANTNLAAALAMPAQKGKAPNLYTLNGETKTLQQWADQIGIKRHTLGGRIRHGSTLAEALRLPVRRKAGVVSDFAPFEGTGAGSTAQESPEITFSEKAENA